MDWMRRLAKFMQPLFSRRMAWAWGGAMATLLAFDLLWCMATNFRPLGFVSTYVFAAVLALLLALPTVLSHRRWIQLTVLLVFDIWLTANLMYCRTYFEAIPPASYLLGGNVAQFTDSIRASMRWYDIVLPLIAAGTFFGLGRNAAHGHDNSEGKAGGRRAGGRSAGGRSALRPYMCTLGGGVVVCTVIALCHGGLVSHIQKLKDECYMHGFPPVLYTLPVSFAVDLAETLTPVSAQDIALANAYLEQHPRVRAVSQPQRDNVVMIFVESLEGWPIGKTVEGQELTPNLNDWVADSTSWSCLRVVSQVGTGRSIDGQLLMTTGLMPTRNHVYSMRYANSTFPSLAKELHHAMGTRSYMLSGDRANTWNQGVVAMSFGIDERHYRDDWDSSESFTRPRNPSDKSLIRQITGRMQDGQLWPVGQKALVEVVTYSSHMPFNIPPPHRTISLSDSYPADLRQYMEAVNYADGALGQFVDYLKTRPDWPRTMVVIVGDHEGLASMRGEILSHGQDMRRLVDADNFVPMVVLNAPTPGSRSQVMGQVDVYSTIIDQLGIVPVWPGLGFSAVSAADHSKAGTEATLPLLTVDYAHGYPHRPQATNATDSLQLDLIDRQSRVGNAIIAADILKDRYNL